jgi:hypothetical protein
MSGRLGWAKNNRTPAPEREEILRLLVTLAAALLVASCATWPAAPRTACDSACLETIAAQYRAAYLAHDRSLAPFAPQVRYTENNIEMPFPEGTWDTVTAGDGTPLVLSDPTTGQVAMITAIMQKDTPGFLAIRLRVRGRVITEAEHIISTRRNLSSPPTPIGTDLNYPHDPTIEEIVPPTERVPRERLIAHGEGYAATLEHNNGEIRGTSFAPGATRRENGLLFTDIEGGFRSGRYAFNNRVRREPVLVDEARQIVLMRGFIDHKGVMDEYKLTDGTPQRSVFREPQTWAFLEIFKVKHDQISAVEAVFVQAPYYMRSPWTE